MAISNIKKKKRIVYISYAALLFIIYIFEYSANIASPIGRASVSVLMPAALISAIMFKEWAGAFYGLAVGAAVDAVSADSFIFNTLVLFVLCCMLGLLIKRIFLNNTVSAIILLVGGIFTYYLLEWMFCQMIVGNPEAGLYLAMITLPSALYSSLVAVPLYLLIRAVYRKIVHR